ncbi:cytochrome b/b6 domain-containing protein [Devosia psychrophila]|uniref:Uncharacterized protein n=1 Tax=Devosia psychrophila TaxID=728005 RepID=A0A0F5PSW0_9HYPH|nr:cytochrome b/b6 domain-containing protein [Devosia psychrophila]KKC31675.1 hypothetical protein WH91_18405 [Devosia psychrophila]SFB93448.1 hypothetical protein SAMN04488059_101106 [Devosia psychrophila]
MLISGLAEANATDPETQFTLLRGYAIICSLIGVVTVHGIVARVLIALLIGHIGAALYHQSSAIACWPGSDWIASGAVPNKLSPRRPGRR